mmetsp:Transcript_57436/g.153119  ORF Transcript_57436/g.153119 Transcript_57436/m.153119 type:complete len:83 (-) Transcript_57436:6-254(-)
MVFRGCCLVLSLLLLRDTASLRVLESEERTSPVPTPVPTQSLPPTIAPTETGSTSAAVAKGRKKKNFFESIHGIENRAAPTQ